jgi:hypothetical protein
MLPPLLNFRKITAQRGNALFLILIAVALFAALSYAITQSGRGGGTATKEQNSVIAASAVEYPATLRTVIMRMIIAGSPGQGSGTAVSLAWPETGQTYQVFDPAGGAWTAAAPPSGVAANMNWIYIDANSGTTGFFVQGIGTDSFGAFSLASREVLVVLAASGTANVTTTGQGCTGVIPAATLSLAQCEAINVGLGQASPGTPSSPNFAPAWTPTTGVQGASINVGTVNSLAGAGISGVPFQCISMKTTGSGLTTPWAYYHVLVEN